MSNVPPYVGSFWPFALGVPAGALGGYYYRKWQETHPGKWVPFISGELNPGGAPLHDGISQETNVRFWVQTSYKPGQHLDPNDPQDQQMIPIWNDIFQKVSAEAAAAKQLTAVRAAGCGEEIGGWPWGTIYDFGPPAFVQHGPWIDIVGKHADPIWNQPRSVLRARGSRVAQYGNTKPGVGPYIGVELFGPPEHGLGHDLYRAFSSLDAASDWLANEAGIVIYRAIYDATDPTWPSPISELFGNSQMTRMSGSIGTDGHVTRALIKSATHEVQEAAQLAPAPAFVWSLDPPSPAPRPGVELAGTSIVLPFASLAEALDYARSRVHAPHVAVATFDRRSAHWPNPVAWTKSDDPSFDSTIAQQISRTDAIKTAGEIVGAGPWASIVGNVAQDVRARAKALATAKRGGAVGVIHAADGMWYSFAFDSTDDADDWFGSSTQDRSNFTYAAYYGKMPDGSAYLENEAFGGPRHHQVARRELIRRGIATTEG